MRVISVRGVASVQDGGRAGRRHRGLPPGGALVPEALAQANRAVGNPDDAPGIELIGGLVLGGAGEVAVSAAAGVVRVVDVGGELCVPARPEVRYVAVPGGFLTEVVWGSRGASWSAGILRPLKAGDELPVGPPPGVAPRLTPDRNAGASPAVEIVPGPDLDAFSSMALADFLLQDWIIDPRSDRTGHRLGPGGVARVDEDDRDSAPMVRGAIQVPRDGRPVVLGPDHPVTGGYPVLACVVSSSWGRVGGALPGSTLRFTLAGGR